MANGFGETERPGRKSVERHEPQEGCRQSLSSEVAVIKLGMEARVYDSSHLGG